MCCCGSLNSLLLSTILGELNAISTSLGTSIFDASSNKESSSLFEMVSNLSSVKPSMSIKLSSWGMGGGGAAVTMVSTAEVPAKGYTGRMLLLTVGSTLRKSSSPVDDSLTTLVSVAAMLRASAKMSSLLSPENDITGPYIHNRV